MGAHAVALGVVLLAARDGSSVLPLVLLAYAGLPWWPLVDVVFPSWLESGRFEVVLVTGAVLNVVLHAGVWVRAHRSR